MKQQANRVGCEMKRNEKRQLIASLRDAIRKASPPLGHKLWVSDSSSELYRPYNNKQTTGNVRCKSQHLPAICWP